MRQQPAMKALARKGAFWRRLNLGLLAGLLAGLLVPAIGWGQVPNAPSTAEIYTCVDASGRKHTSDRPIKACLDREQTLLNPSGTVKAKIGPKLTAREQSEFEAKNRMLQSERARLEEEKRQDRALLIRYPTESVHQKERAEALANINQVKQSALVRTKDLLEQKTKIDDELAFYQKDASKAPPKLRHQLDDINAALAAQGRFLAEKDAEGARINSRFDAELKRLTPLWQRSAASVQ